MKAKDIKDQFLVDTLAKELNDLKIKSNAIKNVLDIYVLSENTQEDVLIFGEIEYLEPTSNKTASTRLLNFMKSIDVFEVTTFKDYSRADLKKFRNIGDTVINEIETILLSKGLKLR